jgi:DNA-directed RNA polymerase subunit beta'
MLATTVGQILVNEALPPAMRNYARILDKKGSKTLFQELAEKHPEKYREISHQLLKIGGRAGSETGGFSFGLKHIALPEPARQMREGLKQQVQAILANPKLQGEDRNKAIVELMQKSQKPLTDLLFKHLIEAKNPLAQMVESGAKGSPDNLRSIIAGDLLYEGHKGAAIPFPILHSFAEGYTPAEYWAHTYGARKGIHDLKAGTQDAGYFGKQLNQVAHRLIATKHDFDEEPQYVRGLPVPVDDPDSVGALLAQPIGGYKKNTVITPKILAELKSKGHDKMLVRSPMLSGPPEGGVYARDAGIRERGGLPPIGDFIGNAAAQALGEPVAQAQISSKHTGGVAGASGSVSGFKYINQLVQVPKVFTGGAAHAEVDGRVGAIYPAPAGGTYIMVGNQRHYAPAGQAMKVKPGDQVEAGDIMSDGLPNPAKIVEHKGIGEGQRYFVNIARDVYKASNIKADRRNLELLARGLVNHVRLTDEMGDYMPDDVVPYSTLEHTYQPRPGHTIAQPKRLANWYLEKPALHYSIGTQLKPSVIKELDHFKVPNVIAHPDPPPFKPEMIRAMESLQHDPDYMTRMLGSNLKKSLLTAAHRGTASDESGTSFVAPLSEAKPFARQGLTKGWTPGESFLGGTPVEKGGSVL